MAIEKSGIQICFHALRLLASSFHATKGGDGERVSDFPPNICFSVGRAKPARFIIYDYCMDSI
eukprot:scaffold64586_cov50-Attheya_sp.AAC.5